MPNLDKTGPEGKGSKTGRGLGNCPDESGSQRVSRVGRPRGLGNRGQGQGRNAGRPRLGQSK